MPKGAAALLAGGPPEGRWSGEYACRPASPLPDADVDRRGEPGRELPGGGHQRQPPGREVIGVLNGLWVTWAGSFAAWALAAIGMLSCRSAACSSRVSGARVSQRHRAPSLIGTVCRSLTDLGEYFVVRGVVEIQTGCE